MGFMLIPLYLDLQDYMYVVNGDVFVVLYVHAVWAMTRDVQWCDPLGLFRP